MTTMITTAGRKTVLVSMLIGTLASAPVGAEQPTEGLVGTWVSQDQAHESWKGVEIEIAGIDERGRATGVYCSTREDGSFFGFELHPKGGVKTSMKEGVLTFERHKRRYALAANEDGTMGLGFRSKDKKWPTATFERGTPAGCLTRVAPVGERISHDVSAEDETDLVGIWAGKTSKRNLEVEIHLAHVSKDGQATGLYCWTRKDRSIVAFDVGPRAPTQTVIEDGTLKAPRGDASFEVKPKGVDRLEFTFRKDGRKRLGAKLERSEAKGCLTHIRMLDSAAGG